MLADGLAEVRAAVFAGVFADVRSKRRLAIL
jgi:hypothetical protein